MPISQNGQTHSNNLSANVEYTLTKSISMNRSHCAQFHIESYQHPAFRKYRNKNGGGIIVHVKEGLMAESILEYENINIETICIGITISKRKWCLTFAYRPPYNNNKATLIMELNKTN